MRMISVKAIVLASFLLILAGCSGGERMPSIGSEPSFYHSLARGGAAVDERAAREMISLYRQNNGLLPVRLDPELQRAAQVQAESMAKAGVLDHEVRGSLGARLATAGIGAPHAVENVSAGYHTLAEAFSGWRQSALHNKNLLDPHAIRMGIATAYAPGSKYKVYWTLIMTD
jgi:uncharacterized protein YkwD